eukprot:244236-Pelagomonas_calceolata.AAC.2
MSHPAKWPSQPTQCPQLPSHTSVTCCFLGPACAPCGIRARMARVASDSAACRPGSTRALPEAATALTLAILPWNGCDQSLNSYACEWPQWAFPQPGPSSFCSLHLIHMFLLPIQRLCSATGIHLTLQTPGRHACCSPN